MDSNKYRKIVHASLFFGNKIALAKRLKPGFHYDFWSDAGGKVENNETLVQAIQRETKEETGWWLWPQDITLVDCFIYPERELKTFLFVSFFQEKWFNLIKNTEPDKQSPWQLFTMKEALKLQLMPSVRYFLENYDIQKYIKMVK